MSFLTKYKLLLRIFFVFGLCSLSVNKQNTQVNCTIRTQCYTIFYFLCIIITIVVLAYFSFLNTINSNYCNNICKVALFIQLIGTIFLYGATMLLSLYHSKDQLNYIILIQAFDNDIKTKYNISLPYRNFFKAAYFEVMLIFFIYVPVNCYGIYQYQLATNIWMVIYYIIFAWISLSNILLIFHMKLLAKVLVTRFKNILNQLINNEKFKQREIVTIIQCLIELFEMKDYLLQKCLGTKLLLIQTLDFVLMTTTIFYFIFDFIYSNEPHFKIHIVIYVIWYIFPTILKNIRLARVFTNIGDQVTYFH